jgi:hypothetical protein
VYVIEAAKWAFRIRAVLDARQEPKVERFPCPAIVLDGQTHEGPMGVASTDVVCEFGVDVCGVVR